MTTKTIDIKDLKGMKLSVQKNCKHLNLISIFLHEYIETFHVNYIATFVMVGQKYYFYSLLHTKKLLQNLC